MPADMLHLHRERAMRKLFTNDCIVKNELLE